MSPLRTDDTALAEALKRAARLIDAANLPEDLRPAAFNGVLTRILSGTGTAVSVAPNGEISSPSQGEAISRLASKLGVSVDMVVEVYQAGDDGTLEVHIPTAKLSKTKSSATKELALLVMAGRQIGAEEWTDSDVFIPVLEHYGKFDSANNAAIMKDDKHWKISRAGKKRRFQLRKTGWEAAAELVKTMAN